MKIDNTTTGGEDVRDVCETLWVQARQLAEKSHRIVGRFPRLADDPDAPATGIETAERSIRHILALISERADREDPEFIVRLGRARAEAGVPVDQILGALNADFEIVWLSLLEFRGAVSSATVARIGSRMWRSVEKYSTDLLAVYKEREAALRVELQAQSNRFLNGLATGTPQSVASVRGTLLALGISQTHGLGIVASREQLNLAQLHAQGVQYLTARTEADNFLVVVPDTRLSQLLAANRTAEIVYESAVTEESLRSTVFLLNAILLHSQQLPGHRTLDESWWAAMVQGLGAAGELGGRRVLRDVAHETPQGMQRLAETVDALWASSGVSEAARSIQVHRNTFVKRCEKLTQLAGRDPRIPGELAMLKFAFDQYRLRSEPATPPARGVMHTIPHQRWEK
ncbi:helix-turn-helix domain-containing protein [Leucobacter chromiireducens]|uniref:PucR C-terminal helix-turn-helix domain-containing protein n=1 Tax=Leucobacter chromiireducens subsp. solipictus TaxID=398235 RepID=A0ABS1SD99_9MICO|nr:hypothetical protein [Leucobacter chromiireducens subsp. solipictus]